MIHISSSLYESRNDMPLQIIGRGRLAEEETPDLCPFRS